MVENVICIHGTSSKEEYYDEQYPTARNSHYFPWISKQLIIRDIRCDVLEIPYSYAPDYNLWKRELERFNFNENSILVGHSCGGGFLLRYLSENRDLKLKKVILLAPWIDPFDEKKSDFFKFEWDLQLFNRLNIKILYSLDDMEDVLKTIEIIKSKYKNINFTIFENKGHFCMSDIGETFSELLEEFLN